MQGKAQDLRGELLAHTEAAMTNMRIGGVLMDRARVVNERLDAVVGQRLSQRVATLGADDEEVVDMPGDVGRRHDTRSLQLRPVERGKLASPRILCIEAGELHAQHSRLQRVEAAVAPGQLG